jgi:hypothetical protein
MAPLPIGVGVEGPQRYLAPGPISPGTALAALATAPDIEVAAQALVHGLVATVQTRQAAFDTNCFNMQKHIDELHHRIGLLEHRDEEEIPEGYEENKGYVDIPIC